MRICCVPVVPVMVYLLPIFAIELKNDDGCRGRLNNFDFWVNGILASITTNDISPKERGRQGLPGSQGKSGYYKGVKECWTPFA